MKSKLSSYYENEKNVIVKIIVNTIDNDIIFRELPTDTKICLVESMYKIYMDGWNNAKKLLLPDIKR